VEDQVRVKQLSVMMVLIIIIIIITITEQQGVVEWSKAGTIAEH
jgi:hypothetical protein